MAERAPERRDLDPLLAAIRSRLPDVRGIWLFGSLARGTARPDSDIDLAVFAPTAIDPVKLFQLGLDLGAIASRDVDLVDLRRTSTLLRHVVATEGVLVAAIDPPHVRRLREVDPGSLAGHATSSIHACPICCCSPT